MKDKKVLIPVIVGIVTIVITLICAVIIGASNMLVTIMMLISTILVLIILCYEAFEARRESFDNNRQSNSYKTVTNMNYFGQFYKTLKAKEEYASVIISLDNFEEIRNIFSYDGAENIIYEIIDKLGTFIKEDECVAKLKGRSTFILLMHETMSDIVEKRIADMEKVLSSIKVVKGKTSYDYYGQYCTGYCMLREHTGSFEQILDITMLKCKVGHTQSDSEFENREELIKDIDNAMEKSEFIPYFQPVYDTKQNKIVASELLARWKHPKYGVLNAAKFVPLLEIAGRIDKLDILMLEEACIMIQEWVKRQVVPVQLAVNVSITNFYKKDFVDNIFKMVERYQVPACLIELNIRCVTLSQEEKQLRDIFSRIKQKGFHISINNFENAKIKSKLFDMWYDILKLDYRTLADNREKSSDVYVKALIKSMSSSNVKFVVTKVETEEELNKLKGMGCSYVQGYAVGMPVSKQEYEKIIF